MAEVNKYVQLTSLSAAKSFAVTGGDVDVPEDATSVTLQAETQPVRYRFDGTAPTSSVGTLLATGVNPIMLTGKGALRNLKVIETTTSAKLNIHFSA